MTYNIRDYGAMGDGLALDSKAIQTCADFCKEQGGGTIIVPAGRYLCSSIRLYSNTRVVLEAGAILMLSDREADYVGLRGLYDEYFERDPEKLCGKKYAGIEKDRSFVQLNGSTFRPEKTGFNQQQRLYLQCFRNRTDNLFFIKDAENVTIEGPGVLDGRQELFFNTHEFGQDPTLPRWLRRPPEVTYFLPNVFRPHTIVLMGCKNVRLRDFKILRSPLFNVRVLDSTDVFIDHLFIKGDLRFINTDGINIAGSQNVFVDSCYLQCGDDCIAVSDAEVQTRTQDTKNVLVTNCIFCSKENMTRIFCGIDLEPAKASGVELPPGTEEIGRTQRVENVHFDHCQMIAGTSCANIHATCGTIANIRLTDITSTSKLAAPVLFMAAVGEGAHIQNVRIDGLHAQGHCGVGILGLGGGQIEDIGIFNSQFEVDPETNIFAMGYPDNMIDYFLVGFGPFNFHMRHAKKVSLRNVELRWGKEDLDDLEEIRHHEGIISDYYSALWREDMNPSLDWPAVYAFDCEDVSLSEMNIYGHGKSPKIVIENSENS